MRMSSSTRVRVPEYERHGVSRGRLRFFPVLRCFRWCPHHVLHDVAQPGGSSESSRRRLDGGSFADALVGLRCRGRGRVWGAGVRGGPVGQLLCGGAGVGSGDGRRRCCGCRVVACARRTHVLLAVGPMGRRGLGYRRIRVRRNVSRPIRRATGPGLAHGADLARLGGHAPLGGGSGPAQCCSGAQLSPSTCPTAHQGGSRRGCDLRATRPGWCR